MAKGRKPTPDNVKSLHGSARRDRTNPAKPKPADELPRAPEWLPKRAAEIFGQLTTRFQGTNLASASYTEIQALAAYRLYEVERCDAFIDQHGEFFETTNSQGDWTLKRNPAIAQRNEAFRHLHGLLAEFGASPASAQKVVTEGGSQQEDDPWAQIGGK